MTNEEKAAQWDEEMLALLADVKASIDTYLHRKNVRKGKISRPLAPCLVRAKERFGTEVPRESAESPQLPTGGQQTGQIVKQSELPAA